MTLSFDSTDMTLTRMSEVPPNTNFLFLAGNENNFPIHSITVPPPSQIGPQQKKKKNPRRLIHSEKEFHYTPAGLTKVFGSPLATLGAHHSEVYSVQLDTFPRVSSSSSGAVVKGACDVIFARQGFQGLPCPPCSARGDSDTRTHTISVALTHALAGLPRVSTRNRPRSMSIDMFLYVSRRRRC